MSFESIASMAIRLSAPILLIAIGGLFSMRIGIFQLALEGFTLMGCFAAVLGAHATNSTVWGVLIAACSIAAMALLYAALVFEAKLNPIVVAIALLMISEGLTRYLLGAVFGVSGQFVLPSSLALPKLNMAWLERIPVVGPILNGKTITTYIALILPFAVYVLLYKTKAGMHMRAVGSNPQAAHAVGVSVKRTQYLALAANGFICGLAGAEIALSLYMFNVGMTDGVGFEALAVLTLVNSEPILTLLAGLMFGVSDALVLSLQSGGYVATQILAMLPYALALTVAILPVLVRKTSQAIQVRRAETRIAKGMMAPFDYK